MRRPWVSMASRPSAVAGASRFGKASVSFTRVSHTHSSIQIRTEFHRALRVVMVSTPSDFLYLIGANGHVHCVATQAYSQKRPAGGRVKNDKDGGAGGGRSSDASGGSGGNARLEAPAAAARPRGMSDASYMRGASDGGGSNARGFARGVASSASSNSEY